MQWESLLAVGLIWKSRNGLSVVLVVFNKARYIGKALVSIGEAFRNETPGIEVVIVDDGSCDGSQVFYGMGRTAMGFRTCVVFHGSNLGTHVARLDAVLAVATEFMLVLDPDDVLYGSGARRAYGLARQNCFDLVEFGCRSVRPGVLHWAACWKSPPVRWAQPGEYRRMFYEGVINCHLHRKVIRTVVYEMAVQSMPKKVRLARIVRFEDKLHYAFLVEQMKRPFCFVPELGELRFEGLPDNSQSGTYQSERENMANDLYVNRVIRHVLGRVAA